MKQLTNQNHPRHMKIVQRLLIDAATALLLVSLLFGCTRKAKVAGRLDAAKEYFAKGNDASAEIEFKNVLKLDPGHSQALKGLGLIWVRQGAMLEGGRILSAAKSQLSTDDQIGVNLALAYIDLGFIADARTEIFEVLDRSPANGEALMLLAETSLTPQGMTECEARITRANAGEKAPVMLASALIELRRGNIESGTQTVERILEIAPNFARGLAMKATLHRVNKQPEMALGPLKKASDLAGPRSSERGTYAKLLMELGRGDEAVALLKDATCVAPDYLPNWRLLAQIAFEGGRDAEASISLSKVLARSPLDIEAALVQSQLWLRSKEAPKAVALLEKLATTYPSRPKVELALSKAYLAVDDRLRATSTLDHMLTLVPGQSEATLLRASLYLKDGRSRDSIRLVEPLLVTDPQNRIAQDLLVAAYSAANRLDEAVSMVELQITVLPKDEDLQLQLGQLLRAQGKAAEARAIFERLMEHSSDPIRAVFQLVALDEQEGNSAQALARLDIYLATHPDSAQAHFFKAQLCYTRKEFKAAEVEAEKSIQLNPDDIQAYGMLVTIQRNDGRSEQAIERLRKLLKSSPKDLAILMHLGTLLMELGQIDEARICFKEMSEISPNLAPAYNNMAFIDTAIPGNLDKAEENARKAQSFAPNDPSICDTYGWILWLRGDFKRALPLLQEAVNSLPRAPSVQYHLAMTHYMMHQTKAALAGFEKALAISDSFAEKDQAKGYLALLRDGDQLDLATLETRVKEAPKDVVIMMLLANKLATSGRPKDAIGAYHNALAINSDLETAYLGLADVYGSALNQPDKAIEASSNARKLAPHSPRSAAALGLSLFRIGKQDDAYILLAEAARALPEDSGVQYDYAWAAYSTGRVAEARAITCKLAPSDPARAADTRDFLALTDPNATADPGIPALIERKLTDSPTYVPALMAAAELLEMAGKSPLPLYTKVLEVLPQFDPARKALARFYLADPLQLDAAEKLATAAHERLKEDSDLSGILAIINFRKGQFDYAAQLLAEISAKRPLKGPELFALGMSQVSTNHADDARQTLTLAILTKLPQADADTAMATIEKLEKSSKNEGK